MEKLGLGPAVLMEENPRLIYTRLTGYGQNGSLSERAGHDINFLSISGVLSALGRAGQKPHAPVNLLADFAGGSVMTAIGIMMALHERHRSGKGQIVDASMVEGTAYLSSFLWASRDLPFLWPENGSRGEGLLDGGAASYDTYETKDGKYVAVGALEPQFFDAMLRYMGFEEDEGSLLDDPFGEDMKRIFALKFKERTRDEWDEIFRGVDACVTPVLERDEAPRYGHNRERGSFHDGTGFPLPAPKLDRTPAMPEDFADTPIGANTVEILRELGYCGEDIERLLADGIVHQRALKVVM